MALSLLPCVVTTTLIPSKPAVKASAPVRHAEIQRTGARLYPGLNFSGLENVIKTNLLTELDALLKGKISYSYADYSECKDFRLDEVDKLFQKITTYDGRRDIRQQARLVAKKYSRQLHEMLNRTPKSLVFEPGRTGSPSPERSGALILKLGWYAIPPLLETNLRDRGFEIYTGHPDINTPLLHQFGVMHRNGVKLDNTLIKLRSIQNALEKDAPFPDHVLISPPLSKRRREYVIKSAHYLDEMLQKAISQS
ncbi:MAG: hypothetical protein HEQ32_07035 [Vampirovibrio sp.]